MPPSTFRPTVRPTFRPAFRPAFRLGRAGFRLGLLSAATAVALVGCGSDAQPASSAAPPATPPRAGQTVTIADAWVKAADEGMSAAFGSIQNTGSQEVTIVSAASPATTSMQLHETVEDDAGEMVMRERAGGFVVPAGGTLTLEPGGNHLMLMDLVAPVTAGDELPFTLTFSDGSTFEFTAPAKDFTGADETYDDGGMAGMGSATPDDAP